MVVLTTTAFNLVEAPQLIEGSDDLIKILVPALSYLALYVGLRTEQDLRRCAMLIVLTSAIPVLAGFAEVAMGVGFDYTTGTFVAGERPAGTIGDPNLYGIFLSMCLFTMFPLILTRRSKWPLIYTGMLLVAILVARNRGTWIALALAFMFAVPVFRRHLKVRNWIIAGILMTMLGTPIVIARFAELSGHDRYGQSTDTGVGRLTHALHLLDKASESPVTGYGPGTSVNTWGGYAIQIKMPPHNDYVRTAYEYGIFSTLAYLIFFLMQLRWTLRHRSDRLWQYQFSSCCAQIYLIVISVAQNVLTDTVSYFLIFMIMALSHRASALSATQAAAPNVQVSRVVGGLENITASLAQGAAMRRQ